MTTESEFVIRDLASHDDYAACVALQYETWGGEFKDTVPASILLVSQKIGGVAAGAFDRDGTLVGFVFGMTGIENGRIVHWSDMLAVRSSVRNAGLGRALKEHQRRAVGRIGGHVIYWTYDPLVARNAHLNFNVFGVSAVRYVRDMYGTNTGSELHRGIGTDRLVVAWPVDDAELSRQRDRIASMNAKPEWKSAPIIGTPEQPGLPPIGEAHRIRIAVPDNLLEVQGDDPGLAARWRVSTRAAFERAFAAGHRVVGFLKDADTRQGHYLMAAE